MVFAAGDHIKVYTSPDLKAWELTREFGHDAGNHGGVWECPDLFALTTPDGTEKWVLLVSINPGSPNGGSGTQYFIGDFDGETFTNDNSPEYEMWLDWGRDNYAGVTWSDIPDTDGRRLFIGWNSNWHYSQVVPTEKWRSAMTVPRVLNLAETSAGLRVISEPVVELENLRGQQSGWDGAAIEGAFTIDGPADAAQFEAIVSIDLAESSGDNFGFELSNAAGDVYRFGYDKNAGQLYSDRTKSGQVDFSDKFAAGLHTAPYAPAGNTAKLHMFVDQSSIEVFVDDGQVVMSELVFPNQPFSELGFFSENGAMQVTGAEFYDLKSIW